MRAPYYERRHRSLSIHQAYDQASMTNYMLEARYHIHIRLELQSNNI